MTPTASQPMGGTQSGQSAWSGGYTFTGLSAPANGSASPVRVTDLPPQLPATWPTFTNQACDTTNVPYKCPAADGLIYIDNIAVGAGNLGGNYDANLSQVFGAGVDAATDYVAWPDTTTTFTLAAGVSQWAASTAAALPAGILDYMCRDTTTPFATCHSNATAAGGTCGPVTSGGTLTQAFVVQKSTTIPSGICTGAGTPYDICVDSTHAYRYYPVFSTGATTCTTGAASSLATIGGAPVAFTTSDKIMAMHKNDAHLTQYGSRLLAQRAAEIVWEDAYIPKVNLVTNGLMETDCTSSGWHLTSNYSLTTNMSSQAWSGVVNYAGSYNAVLGNSCNFSTSRTAGDGFTSDAFTVTPNTFYQCQLYAKANDTSGVLFDVVTGASAAPGTSITTLTDASADVNAWHYTGDYKAVSKTSNVPKTDTGGYETAAWGKYLLKFYSRDNSSVRLKITAAGTALFGIDNVICSPAVYQDAGIHPVFPDGRAFVTLDGDSRTATASYWLPEGLDAAFGVWRPSFFPSGTFLANTSSQAGKSMAYLEALNMGFTTSRRPTFGFFFAGINDRSTGSEHLGTITDSKYADTATYTAPWVAADTRFFWTEGAKDIRRKGSIPVLIGEFPALGASTTTSYCQGGTHGSSSGANCGKVGNDALNLLYTNADPN